MPENVDAWWQRRQRSKGCEVPYPVGTYRAAWRRYPVLVKQYHPELNEGRTLSQIPPAADVWLTWQCDTGHVFVATPAEQRSRPGGERRRSVWCPDCAELAAGRRLPLPARPPAVPLDGLLAVRASARPAAVPLDGLLAVRASARPATVPLDSLLAVRASARPAASPVIAAVSDSPDGHDVRNDRDDSRDGEPGAIPEHWPTLLTRPPRTGHRRARSAPRPATPGRSPAPTRAPSATPAATTGGAAVVAAPARPVGQAFWSADAPRPASAAEAELRRRIGLRFAFDLTPNAVAVGRPFFERREVWPDFVIDELRVAIEYDTVGRFGLEHVGGREDTDRRKDRLLREAGWEVVRIRCRPLEALGPHDLVASGITEALLDRLTEVLGALRGHLFVAAYRR